MTESKQKTSPPEKPSAPVPYEAVVGLEWQDAKGAPHRLEPGETSDAIPQESVEWLLRTGAIIPPGKKKTPKKSEADKAEEKAPVQDAQEAPEPGAATEGSEA